MRTRLLRTLSIFIGIMLIVMSVSLAAADTYPYETEALDSVNLRKSASSSAVILAYIEQGDTVTILGETGSYYKVEYEDVTGYAMKKYIDGDSLKDDPEYVLEALSDVTEYPYQTTTTAKVNMRKKASDDSTVLQVVPENAVITVLSVTADCYAKATYDGTTGYIQTDYINLSPIATPTPIPEETVSPEAEKYPTLSLGDTGTFVLALQNALKELNFYKDEVDSNYGSATESAVLAFEKKNSLDQDGIADPEMLYLLFEGTPRNYGGYKTSVDTVPPIYGITMQYGSTGTPVEQLQERLAELGYYTSEITGSFGTVTRAALKEFQEKMGISVDGIATPDVQTILYSASALAVSDTVTPTPSPEVTIEPPTETLRLGDEGEDVEKIQTRLQYLGYYDGEIDGTYGDETYEAVVTFQSNNDLDTDGVCGANTLEALFADESEINATTPTPEPTTAIVITEDVATIKSGSIGVSVLNLQKRLEELGYYTSREDGVYLQSDIDAVILFQETNGLTADGEAGYETLVLLYSDDAIEAEVDELGEEEITTYTTLRYGDVSEEVLAMQERLIELGYLDDEADGNFGLNTKAAVIAFQKANDLVRDGVAGDETLSALYALDASEIDLDTSVTLTKGTVSYAVTQLQERLIALGYLDDDADGTFGPLTSLALIEFQQDQDLTVDGVAGYETLSLLNELTEEAEEEEDTTAEAPTITGEVSASIVQYANWYDEIREIARDYPNVTVYDYTTGISWELTLFSFGSHADGYPTTAEDTAKMMEAFGNETTWTPKAVWVLFSNGDVYIATTHNTAHGVNPDADNNFDGHLCVHFPRTADQVAAIGPYATSHQKAVELGWTATLALAVSE